MNDYMTTKEAAEKWHLSQRQVQNLCKKGYVSGVIKINNGYLIPKDINRPVFKYVCNTTVFQEQKEVNA